MTAPISPQQPAAPSKDAAAVRKRRRRAPAGGAADDCFTCAKRNTKCDRRRPYCSQCLEFGNECSGYKTQLTWGVGVASRGKLRGLSLPIAKAPPVAGAQKKPSPSRSRASSATANNAQWTDQDDVPARKRRDNISVSPQHAGSTPTTPFHYDLMSMSQPEVASPLVQDSWPNSPYVTSLPIPGDGSRYQKFGGHLGSLPLASDALSRSYDSASDIDYMSPMSHSFPRDDVSFMHSPTIMYDTYSGHGSPIPQSPASAIILDHRAPTSCPSLVYAASEHGSSLTSHMDSFEAQLSNKLMQQECDNLSVPELDAYSTSCSSTGPVWASPHDEEVASHHSDQNPGQWPSLFEPQPLHVSSDLIAKMPFFMDYYKTIMCPSMVFIDSSNNPYRDHILQLAGSSQSLQHAICALSACNLRMKRRLSLGQDTRERSATEAMIEGQPEDQSLSEEYQHRNLAINLLNQQLNDPTKSSQDSALATILLLCHYRMAESGVAKFHTQFAGVKKILSMRRTLNYAPSRDSAWMEAIFTYFDAISASINDRESQLNASFYGVAPDAQLLPPGAENFVGCDRELFKTISKLGRLNLLSQHRPVQNNLNIATQPRNMPSRSQSPLGSPLGHACKNSIGSVNSQMGDLYGIPAAPRFDGNGFGTTLDEDEMLSSTLSTFDDHRSTFWREWKEARQALQSWEFDASRMHASLPGPTANQVRDLGSLSEAFRYAALLYTERLASPAVPSSHTSFQNLVSQVVYYSTSLEAGSAAEKFLLWPLFVAGSECVNELQQNIVRAKCRDIMTRSGYMNNMAALDVLERLWAGEWKDEPRSPARLGAMRRGPFTWARCIGGLGVDVEWIMF